MKISKKLKKKIDEAIQNAFQEVVSKAFGKNFEHCLEELPDYEKEKWNLFCELNFSTISKVEEAIEND